jgi:hypothetical protein
MFRRLHEPSVRVTVYWDNLPLSAAAGETVAAALLTAGITAFCPAPEDGTARGPYCMTGHCYGCSVEIDNMPYRQACLTVVSDGMHIRRMVVA